MGDKTFMGTGTLYMDGVCMGSAQIGEIECSPAAETENSDSVYLRIPEKLEATVTVTVYPKRVSRKKLIKKLMGIGIPRNAANKVARMAREQRIPYYLAPIVIPRPDEWGL